jgi:hypothetical protein
MNKNQYFSTTIWGSRLFVNAQFAIGLFSLVTKYTHGETDLQSLFNYADAINRQKTVKLYREIK